MANPQWVTVMSPFGWYPIGEVYSVVPKWEEWHSITRWTTTPEDQPNRFCVVGSYDAPEVSFVLSIRETINDVEVAPTADVELSHSLWLQDGLSDERGFTITEVMTTPEPPAEPAWTGDIKVEVPLAVRRWLGPGRVARFFVDGVFSNDPLNSVRIAYGTLVLRR